MERDVAELAGFGTRFAASERMPAVLDWLARRVREMGLRPLRQSFPLAVGGRATTQTNLYALLPGLDGRLPLLLLAAHHDSVNEGWSDQPASIGDPESPAPGADDNGSGVAVLLECMRRLVADPPERGVIFLFTAAEEMGQAGSGSWAADPPAAARSVAWAVNVDQVGRSRSGPRGLQIYTREPGLRLARRIRSLAETACPAVVSWRMHMDDRLAKSDHGPFLRAGVPAVSISEGAGYYPWEAQGAGDLPERIDPVLLEQTASLVTAIAADPGLPRPGAAR